MEDPVEISGQNQREFRYFRANWIRTQLRHVILIAFTIFIFYLFGIENDITWWFHSCLLFFFYSFLQPLVRIFYWPSTGKPSYIVLNERIALWILAATAYHLPISRYVGVALRLDPTMTVEIFANFVEGFIVIHAICKIFSIISIDIRKPRTIRTFCRDILIILVFSAVVTVICCLQLHDFKERPEMLAEEMKSRLSSSLPAGSSIEQILGIKVWGDILGIASSCYVGATLFRWGWEYCSEDNFNPKPDFLDMVYWYSGMSTDLWKTACNLQVSLKILCRIDSRKLQATQSWSQDGTQEEDFIYDQFSKEEDLWFDFMADTGDGGNSTYSVARLLAQPFICCKSNPRHKLQRGKFLLIGGDLAYPNPSEITYGKRLFLPFENALQAPSKDQKMQYDGPECYIIPGNHDWLDGLVTFNNYICRKNWLGGWFMRQRKSYFALKLPKGWWIFGLDLALTGDMDDSQNEFFLKLARERVGKEDHVIIMTHQPDWLIKWYENDHSTNNVSDLIFDVLKQRCMLRIAGDLHHYMHHVSVSSQPNTKPIYSQHLLVNGCGGAFTHPTHVFRDFCESREVSYKLDAEYPSFKTSRWLGLRNIWNFRKENWQFDPVGGILYFILTFSMFPQCKIDHILQADSKFDFLRSFSGAVWNVFIYMLGHSYVSLVGALLVLIVAIAFVPSKVSWRKRIGIGFLHAFVHFVAALILRLALEVGVEMLGCNELLEVGVEMLDRNELLETVDYHSLYRGIKAIKYLLSAFDVPELLAVSRSTICKNGIHSISRWDAIMFHSSSFLFFWVLSTPVCSFVIGIYLYISVNWLNLHYDEGFSSLRIADYKAITRFHIKPNGDIEVFTLAVDKVPKDWMLDPEFVKEQEESNLSYRRAHPSKWRAASPFEDPIDSVRIIDQFVIRGLEKVDS